MNLQVTCAQNPAIEVLQIDANLTAREVSYEMDFLGQKVTVTNWHPVVAPPGSPVQAPGNPGESSVIQEYDQTPERGPHHRIHRTVRELILPDGRVEAMTNRYVELGNGLHYFENGEWKATEEIIEVFPDGAVARRGPHQVIISGNAAARGAIDIETPDGKRLRSHVLGLSYFDVSTGKSVMIAEVKDSQGELHPPNQVIFPDAFTDIRADLRYTYTKAGFEQDVILRENPPPPETYGFDPRSTRLEVVTEFLDPPAPKVERRHLGRGEGLANAEAPAITDDDLDFGAMRMGMGRAFSLDALEEAESLRSQGKRVLKQWNVVEGRSVLFEAVEYPSVKADLDELPAAPAADKPQARIRAGRSELLARSNPSDVMRSPVQLAQARLPGKGFVLDYQIVNSFTNLVLYGGTTYYVTGPAELSGTTTIEGGAIVKYDRDNYPVNGVWLRVAGPVLCKTSAYHPAILTAKDDNTVGESIPTSTGNPTGTYAQYNLLVQNAGVPVTLEHLQSRYAHVGLEVVYQSGHVFRHCQIAKCNFGVLGAYSDQARYPMLALHNVIIADTAAGAIGGWGPAAITAEQATLRDGVRVLYQGTDTAATLMLTNSLIAGFSIPNTTYTNVFGASSSSSAGVFQTTGGGANYLPANSPYRNAGTTNITPSLLADLRTRTTTAPSMLTGQLTVDTTLGPAVLCDTDVPDLGYHYPRLDYLVSNLEVTGATLVLTNGVVVARRQSPGLVIGAGSKLISGGRPDQPNRLLTYLAVQEQALDTSDSGYLVQSCAGSAEIDLRFTELAFQYPGDSLCTEVYSDNPSTVRMRDCTLWGGGLFLSQAAARLDAVNCLFASGARLLGNWATNIALRNCTFVGGGLILLSTAGGIYTVKECLFDRTDVRLVSTPVDNFGYNGFINGYGPFPGPGNVQLGASPTYQTGPLGSYYLPLPSALVDAGSRLASDAGLYHQTVSVDQAKEGSSQVDIGFHYVAWEPRNGLVGHWRLDENTGTVAGDSSNSGHVGSLVNGPTWTTGQCRSALSFDGVDDSVSATESAALRLPADMTLAFWMRADAGAGDWMRMVGKGPDGMRNYGLWMEGGPSRRLLFQQYRQDTGYCLSLLSASQLTLGSWYHVVSAIQAGTSYLYINGALDAWTGVAQSATTSADPVTFAYAGGYGARFTGALDDVRVYNRALALSEVAALKAKVSWDTDGDLLPDYQEDANGNGTTDSAESDWQNASSVAGGLKVYRPSGPAVLP